MVLGFCVLRAGEVDVQIELALRLGFLEAREHAAIQDRVARIGRMLNGLISSIRPDDSDESDAP